MQAADVRYVQGACQPAGRQAPALLLSPATHTDSMEWACKATSVVVPRIERAAGVLERNVRIRGNASVYKAADQAISQCVSMRALEPL